MTKRVVCIVDGLDQLTKDLSYEVSESPTIYHNPTTIPLSPYYVVTCNDGKMRLYPVDNFIELDKLNQLGI